ncbi:MAG: GAF domain-containing protein [Bacteroidetes bacterium]|nr:GAF domain-containing protein [Bacteroidota bacterium]
MASQKKTERYLRIYQQLKELLDRPGDRDSRMATVVAVLHHKMEPFFWTGFYCLTNDELIVRTYQGPLACQILKKNTGVCWTAILQQKTIIVPDVHKFPGHIACDSRSQSEIVIPMKDNNGKITGVLDIDSEELNAFDEIDAENLEKIVGLI